MQIDYTAKRSLKSGHAVDTAYVITVDLSKLSRNYKAIGNQAVSLSGNVVSSVHRYEETHDLQTVIVTAVTTPDIDDMIEFLDSVASGEIFELDLSGASEPYVMAAMGRAYRTRRIGSDDIFQYSFKVRKL